MKAFVFKYVSLIGGLNNLVEQGETFIVHQLTDAPNALSLAKAIEQVKEASLYSKPKFVSGALEVGERFETVNWSVVRIE